MISFDPILQRTISIHVLGLLPGLLLVPHCAAQESARAAGGALPKPAEVFDIPWELPFAMPKGYVLPPSVDLSPWFPPAGDQFAQASCSGWALGYGLATYQWNRALGRLADTTFLADQTTVFSPAFVYTQVAAMEQFTDCTQGVSLPDAIQVVCSLGNVTWRQFPFDTATHQCLRPIPESVTRAADRHRMAHPVAINNRDYTQWRYHLSQGEPVIFLVSIGPAFQEGFLTGGSKPFIWNEPLPVDWSGREGHIMVCTGYENDSTVVALNSWGESWGLKGYVTIPDTVLAWLCSDAYVLRPGTAPMKPDPIKVVRRPLNEQGTASGKFFRSRSSSTDGLLITASGMAPNGQDLLVTIRGEQDIGHLHTLALREGQPVTFHHDDALYTLGFIGRILLFKRPRWSLTKESPYQREILRSRLETYDLHGDGVIDGSW